MPALFAYRTAPIESIRISPAMMNYGRHLKMLLEFSKTQIIFERVYYLVKDLPIIRTEAQERLKQKQRAYDKKSSKNVVQFKIGQQVLLKKETFQP